MAEKEEQNKNEGEKVREQDEQAEKSKTEGKDRRESHERRGNF